MSEDEIPIELTEQEIITLNFARLAYFAFGFNIGLIGHGIVSCFRIFKKRNEWPFILCMWGLLACFVSTMFSYASAYWTETDLQSSILTTFDGNSF